MILPSTHLVLRVFSSHVNLYGSAVGQRTHSSCGKFYRKYKNLEYYDPFILVTPHCMVPHVCVYIYIHMHMNIYIYILWISIYTQMYISIMWFHPRFNIIQQRSCGPMSTQPWPKGQDLRIQGKMRTPRVGWNWKSGNSTFQSRSILRVQSDRIHRALEGLEMWFSMWSPSNWHASGVFCTLWDNPYIIDPEIGRRRKYYRGCPFVWK